MIRLTTPRDLDSVERAFPKLTYNLIAGSDIMFLMNEELARAHTNARRDEARHAAMAARLARAQRAERRAAEAQFRARRALAQLT